MKSPSLGFQHARNSLLAVLLMLAAARLVTATGAAQGSNDIPLDIGVRSFVDKPLGKLGKLEPTTAPEHGKVYYLAAVKEIHAEEKLVRPVNEAELRKTLHEELNRRGFRRAVKGQPLEIILTAEYGRGYLVNPYTADASMNDSGMTDAPVMTINGAWPEQLLKQKETGFEGKLQKAEYEKLYIKVTAWQNPPPAPGKFKMLWKTTMVVDDPDHRDLNSVFKEMLAAGGGYFDHEAKEPEVDVYQPLPDGHVKVGTPEVVEPPKGKAP